MTASRIGAYTAVVIAWTMLLLAGAAAGAELCRPVPPADDLPRPAAQACPDRGPTADKVRRDLEGACGRLHRHVIASGARDFERDLDPYKGRLLSQLRKVPVEDRVVALWNQDSAGKEACVRTPHVTLCDPEQRADWLERLISGDAKLVTRVRDLYTWYLQAQKACETARADPEALGKVASNRKRFSAELKRFTGNAEDVARLAALHADYGSPALDLSLIQDWQRALDAWEAAITRSLPKKAAKPAKPKARPKKAETAEPD